MGTLEGHALPPEGKPLFTTARGHTQFREPTWLPRALPRSPLAPDRPCPPVCWPGPLGRFHTPCRRLGGRAGPVGTSTLRFSSSQPGPVFTMIFKTQADPWKEGCLTAVGQPQAVLFHRDPACAGKGPSPHGAPWSLVDRLSSASCSVLTQGGHPEGSPALDAKGPHSVSLDGGQPTAPHGSQNKPQK